MSDRSQDLACRHGDGSPLAFLIGLGMAHEDGKPLVDQLDVGELEGDELGPAERRGEPQGSVAKIGGSQR
ncbi:hypothetical protein LH128_20138 [Sphingomonas sp. LH128]|nr:hypothetical protein LH128_20138 [Sphingomonas sp. LH128]